MLGYNLIPLILMKINAGPYAFGCIGIFRLDDPMIFILNLLDDILCQIVCDRTMFFNKRNFIRCKILLHNRIHQYLGNLFMMYQLCLKGSDTTNIMMQICLNKRLNLLIVIHHIPRNRSSIDDIDDFTGLLGIQLSIFIV